MHIVRDNQRRLSTTPGGNASTPLATPSTRAADVSVIRQRQEAGGYNPAHWHDREEVMVMLSGQVRVTGGDTEATLETGDTLIIPAETLHQIQNDAGGSETAEWLLIAPAGVRFFHANGEEAHPDWAK